MKATLRILLLCLLVFSSIAFASSGDRYIRVLISKDITKFNLYIKGRYEIRSLDDDNILSQGTGLNTKIYSESAKVNINKQDFDEAIIIYPRIGYFYLNNHPLKGALIIKKQKDSKLLAINYINLEDYVKGVLFHEVSHRWPIEALKAQAVATRTYALYHAKINKDREYDLTASMYSQVYGGKNSERYRTNKAVEYTKGLVLTYRGEIFPAYFHATCAGATEDADQLWDIDLIPLKSISCRFCIKSPHFRWKKYFKLSQISKRLNTSGYKINNLEDIQIIDRNRSGRARSLKLISDMQSSSVDSYIIISAKDFRQILGPKEIRSTNFSIKIIDKVAYFEGFGWGHGVGLCQWGAYSMSRKGYKYQTILRFYYPGAQIDKISKL